MTEAQLQEIEKRWAVLDDIADQAQMYLSALVERHRDSENDTVATIVKGVKNSMDVQLNRCHDDMRILIHMVRRVLPK